MRYLVMIFFILCSFAVAQSNIDEDSIHFIGQASAFTVGANLVTNGDFAADSGWTKGTGWTTAGGDADCNGSAGGNTELLSDTAITTVTGTVYRIQFEVTVFSAGNVVAVFDGVEVGGDKAAVGVYTTYVAATDNSSTISLIGDSSFIGSCDNVSVVAWVGDPDAAGGTTIAGLKIVLDAGGSLLDYMTADGGVLEEASGLDIVDNGGNVQIDRGTSWSVAIPVGTFVNVVFSAPLTNIDSGIFEIITVGEETITIDGDSTGLAGQTASIWVGGALPDISTAINDSTLSRDNTGGGAASIYRKRYICVNVDQEVDAVTDFVAETSETAHREDDGSRKLIGFYDSISVVQPAGSGANDGYRVVSDMDQGGIYYGGAWQAFKSDEGFSDVRPNGKWIEWNGKGNAINILELNTSNFETRNIYFHNVDTSGTDSILHADTAIFNTTFRNCRFAEAGRWQKDASIASSGNVVDCYFAADVGAAVVMTDCQFSFFTNSIINGTGNTFAVVNSTKNTYLGCLFYKGETGVELDGAGSFLSCIFFDQTLSCINIGESTDVVSLLVNNIFSPVAASDIAIEANGTDGSISPAAFNNIMYSVSGGAILTNPISHTNITPNPPLPVGTIELDPLFVNPGDGDFRLRVSSPALNGGMRSLFGGYTTIGANGPYSSPEAGYRPRYNFKGHNYSDR